MAYKDKQKQREANRAAAKRYRVKGMTQKQGMTDGSMDIHTLAMMDAGCGNKLSHGLPPDLNPMGLKPEQMRHVVGARPGHTINTGHYKRADQLALGELNRVSLPGDADYEGVGNGQDNG